ncbi:MAG: thioredoxin domain-containing protein [Chloroflexota bacterium]|nr:thioredoxin domain-containing protein [Chloroflexota bacterium]
MLKLTAIVLTLLLAVSIGSAAWAQNLENPYAGTPQSRTDDGAFVLGDTSARMRFIEFSDFLCGFCQNYEPVAAEFIQEYVLTGEAQFEYRMFPVVDSLLSPLSAALAECADTLSPGSFWLAHDLLFGIAAGDGFTEGSTVRVAEELDLDHDDLVDCASAAKQYQIDQHYGLDLGVQGTPSLFVQYDGAAPVAIAHALPEHFPALVEAIRPETSNAVTIEDGPYAGLSTFRSADGGFVLGAPDAPLAIVAFEDFLCRHCQSYLETVHSFIESHVRGGMAQFEYRFYPLIDPQYSAQTAQIAECVGHLDMRKFWDGHDLLFEMAKERELSAYSANDVAESLDLDAAALISCMERSIQFLIDVRLGQAQGVTGTPAIRARRDGGELDVIFAGQQALDRGGAPLDLLVALADGLPGVTVGSPELSVLDSTMLLDTSLFTGDPCGPPCWQNISPGKTDMREALEILSGLDSISITEATDADIVFAYESGAPCCQIVSDDGGLVAGIVLQLAPQVLVGELIQQLGEPEYVTGMPFSEKEYLLVLVYPENSAFLYAMVTGAEGVLDELSPVVTAIYSTDERMRQVISTSPFDNWKGYLSYSQYMDGEFDNNP